jgi:DNA/RNA endonuclease YhcR with UshA esterase domain
MKCVKVLILFVVVCLVAFTIVSCGSSATTKEETPTTPESVPQTSPSPPPSKWNDPTGANVISANDAAGYYGQNKIVQGLIVKTYNSGKACFLDFRLDYQNGFVGVIFANAFPSFPSSPETNYMNKEVRVSGQVTQYQGHPQIIIESPNQIEVAKDSVGITPAPAPTPSYSDGETDERNLEDAGIYQDENGDYVDEEGNPVDVDDYR